MSYLKFTNGAAPSTPGAGLTELFVDSADKNLAQIDDAGLIKKFASAASAVLSASNVGTLGTGLFKQKTGTELEFYKLNSADTKLAIALIGTDRIDFTINANNVVAASTDARLSDARTPLVHATSHKSGGSDVIKLDELAAPTDIATLNASTTAHGLLKKLSNVATEFMNGQGNWATNAFSGGDVSGYIRVQGTGSTPGVGAGLELHYSGGIGVVMSYNSVGPVYTPLIVDALNTKFSINGTARGYLDATRFSLHQAQALGWTATTAEGALDVALYRNSAGNWIEQRNGTNAQSWSLLGTYVGGSDYERLTIKHGTTAGITFTSEALGAGMVARDFAFMGGNVGIGAAPPSTSQLYISGTSGAGGFIRETINNTTATGYTLLDIGYVLFASYNTSFVTSGAAIAQSGQVWSSGSGGLTLVSSSSPGSGAGIRFYTTGTAAANLRAHIDYLGQFILSSALPLCWGSTGVATPDTFLYRGAAALIGFGGTSASFPGLLRSGAVLVARLADNSADCRFQANDLALSKTITAPGTTGAQTINKATGRVNFAAAAQTLVVTNSLVDANSVIAATVATDDATALNCKAIPAAGSFTLKLNAAATAETAVNFRVTN